VNNRLGVAFAFPSVLVGRIAPCLSLENSDGNHGLIWAMMTRESQRVSRATTHGQRAAWENDLH
jgi:hypothetical protein